MKAEGNQTVTNCHGLKMLAEIFAKSIWRMKQFLERYLKTSKKVFSKVTHVISNEERNLPIGANTKNFHVVTLLRMTFCKSLKQSQNFCLIGG